MTTKKLKQYHMARREVSQISAELEKYYDEKGNTRICTRENMVLHGRQQYNRLTSRLHDLTVLIHDVESWLFKLDPIDKGIVEMYLTGKSWTQISMAVYNGYYSAEYVRKRLYKICERF